MGFERCHPAVNLIFFAAVLAGTCCFLHPVFLAISFLCAFLYSLKRNGIRALVFNLCLLPLILVFGLYYSSYHHFGMTVLGQNFIGNQMTLESLVYGLVLGTVIAAFLMWMSCLYAVVSSDKIIYLFGRVSPRLSLFLSILLRMVPRVKTEARRIHLARQGIGRGLRQGNPLARVRNAIAIFSMLITWTLDALATASDSMRSRGSTLKGRTAFSIYRFDNRDRAYVILIFACLTVVAMGVLLRQTDILYNPRILLNPITSMSWLFYGGYLILCLMPFGLELWTEFRFRQARRVL